MESLCERFCDQAVGYFLLELGLPLFGFFLLVLYVLIRKYWFRNWTVVSTPQNYNIPVIPSLAQPEKSTNLPRSTLLGRTLQVPYLYQINTFFSFNCENLFTIYYLIWKKIRVEISHSKYFKKYIFFKKNLF